MNKSFIVVASICCVAIAGCAASAEPASTTTAAESPQSQPSASTIAAPTPAEPASDAFLVSGAGIGPVSIGADIAKLGVAQGFAPSADCRANFFKLDGEDAMVLSDTVGGTGLVQSVYLFFWGEAAPASAFATAAGVGIGSTLTDLQAAYPDGVLSDNSLTEEMTHVFFAYIDGIPVVFQLADADNTVRQIGVNTDHFDSEYCG